MERLTRNDRRVVGYSSAASLSVSYIGTFVLDERLDGPINQLFDAGEAKEQANALRTKASQYDEVATDIEHNLGLNKGSEYIRGRSFNMYASANAIVKDSPSPPTYLWGGEIALSAFTLPALTYACVKARRQVKARAKRRSATN